MTQLTLFDQLEVIPAINRWHNTTDLQDQDLKDHKFQAGKLNRKVLDFFKSHSYESYTAWEILKSLGINSVPITSIRRALTDLTTMGYLVRTNIQRPGQYKEKSFCWQIR